MFDHHRTLLQRLKLRHVGIVVAILILALLALVFSGKVAGFSTSLIDTASPEQVGDIAYISGGIGESDSNAMKAMAKEYKLEVVFIQKLNQREEYLADVQVQIFDHHLRKLLNIVTDGPYLLLNMPQGKYLIVSDFEGVVKQQWVNVDKAAHQKVVFWWPIPVAP